MFSFLGLRKDSKKSTSEKEVDGGFVMIGETVDEQRRKMQTMNIAQLSTNVIVQPSKSPSTTPAHPGQIQLPTTFRSAGIKAETSAGEAPSTLPDLLGDIPFTLAPHVLAMQGGLPIIPDVLFSQDFNYNLAHFQYDFTLENSVLHDA